MNTHQSVGKQVFPKGKSSSDHRTPWDFFHAIDKKYKFNLDVAASDSNKKCLWYFSEEDNALAQDWESYRVWCNPPYNDIKSWVEKIKIELQKDMELCALLVPSRTDTKWFKEAFNNAHTVYFIQGRLKFTGPNNNNNGNAPFPSVLFIFKKHHTAKKSFKKIGPVSVRLIDRNGGWA